MKSQFRKLASKLRLQEHSVLPGETILEVWYENKFIGVVYGADGPGIRFLSKYPIICGVKKDAIINEVLIEINI